MDPHALHRVVSNPSGGTDSLPDNGYVVSTIRAISRESYARAHAAVAALTVIVPASGNIIAALLLGS